MSHLAKLTGLTSFFLDLFGRLDAKTTLETERRRVLEKIMKEQVRGEETGQK